MGRFDPFFIKHCKFNRQKDAIQLKQDRLISI